MREMVLAIRSIWATWHDGAPLDFRGEFYTHTLMTPMFDPGRSPWGVPRVALAGVGERMTEVAGEVADGFVVHPFTTARFLHDVSLPALERGLAASGRTRRDIEVALPTMVVTGDTDEELERGRDALRMRLAFYGSTPAYKVVLDAHGWGDLQPELNQLTKSGAWSTIGTLVTDAMVDEFAVTGRPEELPELLHARFGGLVDRVSITPPNGIDAERWAAVVAGLQR
jgi:probable F420-dependent oxidoreductase